MAFHQPSREGGVVILEAVVTSRDASGKVNIAPMGPEVDEPIRSMRLKPFRSSQTFENLRSTSRAVVHVTDDVELLSAAAIGKIDPTGIVEEVLVQWVKLVDCCRWFAVEVVSWSDDPFTGEQARPIADCEIVHRGEQRAMFGLSRAKHAIVEAAILSTRIDLLGRAEVKRQMEPLRVLVEKTGGAAEHRAWLKLEAYVHE
ncbi:MAG: DUF447 domain-containing protein [Planctomycetaceae bacterium]